MSTRGSSSDADAAKLYYETLRRMKPSSRLLAVIERVEPRRHKTSPKATRAS